MRGLQNAPRSGRQLKLNERAVWHLGLTIHRDQHQSLANITQTINSALPSPVSPNTVRIALKTRLGMSKRIAAMKPFINDKQQVKRLQWAKDDIHWTMTNWERIIWTDESSVEIGKESRECTVWRRLGERYNKECLVPTFKSGRQSLMVWGCISYGWRGPLVRIPSDQQKGVDYMQLILAGPLWDYYTECYNRMGAAMVMEDGAPVHWAKIAKSFRDTNAMASIPHPPQSPDLNPIKHVWKELKVFVNQRPTPPKNKDELWVALQEEWEKIDVGFINALIESMPRRVQAVYEA